MGAPKQKWTSEEEDALKAGVEKHGAGKWRTILKDPEFSSILYMRSNVDLKDKWRNMCAMTNGYGSRDKSRSSSHKKQYAPIQDDSPSRLSNSVRSDEEAIDAKFLDDTMQVSGPKRSIVRVDNLIIEAISTLDEHGGSDKTTIASFIQEQFWAPPDFKQILSAKLKYMTASGKLIKVKRRYRIALARKRKSSLVLLEGGKHRVSPKMEKDYYTSTVPKGRMDFELATKGKMSYEEAALAAARAVAEAEAAIAEAEEAAREAEAAEADAEEARAFALAASKTLKERSVPVPKMMIRA